MAKEQSLPILKVLRLEAVGPRGAWTHDLPDAKREHYHYVTETESKNEKAHEWRDPPLPHEMGFGNWKAVKVLT
jgi:hypothetical protein